MPSDRQAERRESTRREIVDAAWALARSDGLAAITVRDLAARVGLRAPSIYTYFASKDAIYDAMFRDGAAAFEAVLAGAEPVQRGDGAATVMRAFLGFCTEDGVRFQLLFQRTLPGFVPSDQSYAIARRAFEIMAGYLAALGVQDPASVDLWTAVATGLASQQLANDPGGDRWIRLADRATEMLLAATAPPTTPSSRTRTPRTG